MSLESNLISLTSKEGRLATIALKQFLGDIGDVFKFTLPQLVSTDPFYRITVSETPVDRNFTNKNDSDPYLRWNPTYSETSTNLDYFGLTTELGPKGMAGSSGLSFDLPLDIVNGHSRQAMYDIHKKIATAFSSTSTAAAQEQAATATWSTSATATPQKDIRLLKGKLAAGANIRADKLSDMMRVVGVFDYTSALEAIATTEYATWAAGEGQGTSALISLEEKLKAYLGLTDVVILNIADTDGTQIYSSLAALVVVDRTGLGTGFASDRILQANNSGLVIAYLPSDMLFADGQTFQANAGDYQQYFSRPIFSASMEKNAHKDWVFTSKMGYKVYSHKVESLCIVTGV